GTNVVDGPARYAWGNRPPEWSAALWSFHRLKILQQGHQGLDTVMHGHGARIENNIGDFLIQWLALCQQVANTCLWVCRLEQGAIAIARYTRIKLFRGRPQVNHHAPRFKHSSVLGSQHRAATRSQHQISLRRTLFEHRTFAPAEPFFTFDVEDVDNPNPTTAFDLVIEVEEVAPQHASQAATDGGLTGTHHPHQE